MLQFLKYVLATIVGLLVFGLISILIISGIGAAFSSNEKPVVKKNSVLKLDLNSPIREVSVENPFSRFGGPFGGYSEVIGLKDIREALKKAKTDDNIKGVYIRVDYMAAGWATLEEIRKSLVDFKESKKFTVAYGEYFSEKGYYLASAADAIYLNPLGQMEWNGFTAEYDFYKGLLDKLEIKPVVFRVGEYKSAVEPFTSEKMSEPSRRQTYELLTSLNEHYLAQISSSRGIPIPSLKNWADSLSVTNAASSLSRKLITHAGYFDEVETNIKNRLSLKEDGKIEYIGLGNYTEASRNNSAGDFNKRIAVLIAEGPIVSGGEGDGIIDAESMVKQLKKLRNDDKIKGIVLRINSPGGSALASDVIWREIQITRKKKPLVASMSDVAASGGYYLAMGCNKILAEPNTITGSIGIFGMLPNIQNFMGNKLGITFDRVNTNAHSDWPTVTREMTDFEKNKMQLGVDQGYEIFTSKAAEGRKMEIEKLKSLAQGRVWSGEAAQKNGLVDQLGGIDDAINLAAKEAKLKDGEYRVRYYPENKNLLDDFLKEIMGDSEEEKMQEILGRLAPYAKDLKSLQQMEGIQARMPFDLKIH